MGRRIGTMLMEGSKHQIAPPPPYSKSSSQSPTLVCALILRCKQFLGGCCRRRRRPPLFSHFPILHCAVAPASPSLPFCCWLRALHIFCPYHPTIQQFTGLILAQTIVMCLVCAPLHFPTAVLPQFHSPLNSSSFTSCRNKLAFAASARRRQNHFVPSILPKQKRRATQNQPTNQPNRPNKTKTAPVSIHIHPSTLKCSPLARHTSHQLPSPTIANAPALAAAFLLFLPLCCSTTAHTNFHSAAARGSSSSRHFSSSASSSIRGTTKPLREWLAVGGGWRHAPYPLLSHSYRCCPHTQPPPPPPPPPSSSIFQKNGVC